MNIIYLRDQNLAEKLPDLNYADLRDMLPVATMQSLPAPKTLYADRERNRFLAASERDIFITVYRDGAYLYEENGRYTVYSVALAEKLMEQDYTSLKNSEKALDREFFASFPWYWPLMIAGQARLAANADAAQDEIRERLRESREIRAGTTEPPRYSEEWFRFHEEKDFYRKLREEILSAVRELTKREREVVHLLYVEELTRSQTAKVMNVTPQYVSKARISAFSRIRRTLTGNPE